MYRLKGWCEDAVAGLTLQVYLASSLANATAVSTIPAEVLDTYEPCVIEPDHGYTLVYNVTLPAGSKNDTLSVEMCSPGGYDQVWEACSHAKGAPLHRAVLTRALCAPAAVSPTLAYP